MSNDLIVFIVIVALIVILTLLIINFMPNEAERDRIDDN